MAQQVMCAHMGQGQDQNLYWCLYDGTTWTADTAYSNGAQSRAGPGLAVFDGLVYSAHVDASSNDMWWSTFDPATGAWSAVQAFTNGNQTCDTPALCVFQGTLYCVHMGGADTWLWYCTFDPASQTWSADLPFTQNNETSYGPAVVNVLDQAMYCVHKGNKDSNLWWCQFTGADWTQDTQFESGNQTGYSPTVVRYNEQTICVHTGAADSSVWWCVFDGTSWGQDTPIGAAYSQTGPGAVGFGNSFLVAHVAGPGSAEAATARADELAQNNDFTRGESVGARIIQAIEAPIKDDADNLTNAPILCYVYVDGWLTGAWSGDNAYGAGNMSDGKPALVVVDFP